MTDAAALLDLTFLRAQTFDDPVLEREVLELFLAQGRRLLPRLGELPTAEQTATAHLLKGSCLGVGAGALAALLERFGHADPAERRRLGTDVQDGFRVLAVAIERRLDAL